MVNTVTVCCHSSPPQKSIPKELRPVNLIFEYLTASMFGAAKPLCKNQGCRRRLFYFIQVLHVPIKCFRFQCISLFVCLPQESIPKERAGSVQGCINCGRGFGAVLGFVVFGFIGDGPGWQYVHFVLAVCVMAHVPFAFLLTEVPEVGGAKCVVSVLSCSTVPRCLIYLQIKI